LVSSNPMPDIIVIGGGPAGMMAAGQAASLGADVWLLERNPTLGRKLLLTGQGRCNITNNLEVRQFIADCGPKAKFLYPALNAFPNRRTVEFFENLGLEVKLERGGRYFPRSNRSAEVLQVLTSYLSKNRVRILFGHRVSALKSHSGGFEIWAGDGVFRAPRAILATGGRSYPATGSTGDGYRLAHNLGHRIIDPKPTVVPLEVEESFVKELQGLSLKNVALSFVQGKRRLSLFGEMMFTHYGISGPIVLDASRHIGEWIEEGQVACHLDLKPALDEGTLTRRLVRQQALWGRRTVKVFLKDFLPAKLIPVFLGLSQLPSDLRVNQLTAWQRSAIVSFLKKISFTVVGLRGYSEAVATAGGVDLTQVDPKTMRSKIVPGLYFCGEVLDLDGPCGGYNLQIAWSTGYLAGASAASPE